MANFMSLLELRATFVTKEIHLQLFGGWIRMQAHSKFLLEESEIALDSIGILQQEIYGLLITEEITLAMIFLQINLTTLLQSVPTLVIHIAMAKE